MADVLNPFHEITASRGRRGFLKTTLGVGFALAVQPVSAQTITTSAEGLVAGEVKVPSIGSVRVRCGHCRSSQCQVSRDLDRALCIGRRGSMSVLVAPGIRCAHTDAGQRGR